MLYDFECRNCEDKKDNDFKVGDEVYYFDMDKGVPIAIKGKIKSITTTETYTRVFIYAKFQDKQREFPSIFRTEAEARQSIKLVEDN